MIAWNNLINNLPKGLSVHQAARRLRRNYATTRYWLIKRGYHRKDGRRVPWSDSRWKSTVKVNPDKIDWSMRDSDIARKFNVTRQRIGQIRKIHDNGHRAA